MASKYHTAIIELTAKTDGAIKGITTVERRLQTINNRMLNTQMRSRQTETSFSRLRVSAIQLGTALKGIALFALASGMRNLTMSSIDWDKALIKVGKTSDLTGRELEDLGKKITNLSRSLGVSRVELAGIAEIAGQLGVKGSQNIAAFTDTVAKLVRATNLTADVASLTLARTLNLTGEDIQQNVGKLGAVFVELGNNLATTETEIAAVLEKLSAVAPMFDITSEALAGLAAAYSSVGVAGDAATTATRKLFNAMEQIRAGLDKKGLKALTNLFGGSDSDTLRFLKGSDNVEVLQKIQTTFGKFTPVEAKQWLAEMGLDQDRVAKALVPIFTEAGKMAIDLARAEAIKQTALEKETQIQLNSLSGQFDKTIERLKDNVKDVGDVFGELSVVLLKILEKLTRAIPKLFENFNYIEGDKRIDKMLSNDDTGIVKELLKKYGGYSSYLIQDDAGKFKEVENEFLNRNLADIIEYELDLIHLNNSLFNMQSIPQKSRSKDDEIIIGNIKEDIKTVRERIANAISGITGEMRDRGFVGPRPDPNLIENATTTNNTVIDPAVAAKQYWQNRLNYNRFVEGNNALTPDEQRLADIEQAILNNQPEHTVIGRLNRLSPNTNPFTTDAEMHREIKRLQESNKKIIEDEKEIARLRKAATDLAKEEWRGVARSISGELRNVLENAKSFGEGLKDIFDHILTKLANNWIEKNIVDKGASWLGATFGLATGGMVTKGGYVGVGEKGAEIVKLPTGSKVLPNHFLKDFGMGGGTTINYTVNVSSGVEDKLGVKKMVLEGVQSTIPQIKQALARDFANPTSNLGRVR